jgi:hypothetical protein
MGSRTKSPYTPVYKIKYSIKAYFVDGKSEVISFPWKLKNLQLTSRKKDSIDSRLGKNFHYSLKILIYQEDKKFL